MTTGPTFRLRLKLEQVEAEVEAEMAKTRFDALGLAPGASVRLRPLEFGLFPADPAVPSVPVPMDMPQPEAAVT
jgi:TOBE-like domain